MLSPRYSVVLHQLQAPSLFSHDPAIHAPAWSSLLQSYSSLMLLSASWVIFHTCLLSARVTWRNTFRFLWCHCWRFVRILGTLGSHPCCICQLLHHHTLLVEFLGPHQFLLIPISIHHPCSSTYSVAISQSSQNRVHPRTCAHLLILPSVPSVSWRWFLYIDFFDRWSHILLFCFCSCVIFFVVIYWSTHMQAFPFEFHMCRTCRPCRILNPCSWVIHAGFRRQSSWVGALAVAGKIYFVFVVLVVSASWSRTGFGGHHGSAPHIVRVGSLSWSHGTCFGYHSARLYGVGQSREPHCVANG